MENPDAAWKRYPYELSPPDPELVFPDAEGDQGAESNTYYVAGRLRGRNTANEWAFLVIFTCNDVHHRLRADFHTFALFDLKSGAYGTSTELDFPRFFRWRRAYRLSVARGGLEVSFRGSGGESFWKTRRDANGSLVPFAYTLCAIGLDAEGRTMRIDLELDPRKPPMPVGGHEYRGVKTCMGQYGTHSYFQSDVRFSGTLAWGDLSDQVDGDSGWIDRQWAPLYLGTYTDRRNTRYRHEWRQINLDNGIEMSVWMHFDRRRGNRPIPFTGVTAAGPSGQLDATTDVQLERLSFVRDPGHVRPLYPLAGPKYFTDRYRLRVPAWELELESEPLVPAPAHLLPIEYWSGPTRITGTLGREPVAGLGFHERTLCFSRDFEMVDVLCQTLRQLPRDAFEEDSPTPLAAANLAWEIDGFLSHRDHQGALRHLASRVRPEIERLTEPHRATLVQIADDTADALFRWWVRP
jgi:hydroxyneurosporene synthase CrtC